MIKGFKKIVFAMFILATAMGYGDSIVALPLSKIWDTNEVYTAAQVDKKVSEGVGNGGGGALADALADDTVMLMEEWVDSVAADEDKCAFPPEIYFTSSMFGMASNDYIRSFTVVTASSPEYLPLVPVWCELRDTNDTVLATSLKEICTNTSSEVRFTFTKAISILNTKSLYKVRFNWEGYQDITQFESNKVFGVRVKVANDNAGPYMLEYGQTHHNWRPQMTVTYGTGTTIAEELDKKLNKNGDRMTGDLDINAGTDHGRVYIYVDGFDGGQVGIRDSIGNEIYITPIGMVINPAGVQSYGVRFPTSAGTLALLENIAPAYSPSGDYTANQLLTKDNVLKKCTKAGIGSEAEFTDATVQDVLSALDSRITELPFREWYPDGSVTSEADFTTNLLFDVATKDTVNHTIKVCPFAEGPYTDNSHLAGRIVIPPYVDIDGERYIVNGVAGQVPGGQNENLTSIVAPTTVKTIEADAFEACKALEEASFPGVTTIGEVAFEGCSLLKALDFPELLEVGEGAFAGCERAEILNLPKATTMGTDAFYACYGLKAASLPALTNLLGEAFIGCTNLTSVYAPSAIYVERKAFQSCTSLKEIVLDKALEVDRNAFEQCSSLETISLPSVKVIDSYAFSRCSSLKSISMPLVERLTGGSFNKCIALETIALPNAITIGDNAFNGCTNLTSVILPSAQTIGAASFGDCKALIAIELPNVKSVGGGAFDSCVYLQSASLPLATITSNGIFKSCVALEDVNIPKATLLENTFQNCTNLKKVSLPNVVEIANLDNGLDYNYTFHGCQNLTLIDFGDTVRSTIPYIGSQTFYNVPTNCVIVVPDSQYAEWTTTNGWENLVAAGYKFYRHSEWDYMHRFEFEEAKEPLKAEIVTMADEIRLRLAEWYPDGSVISESQYTDGIKYDIENRDSANLTIETLPFCNTGSADDDNSDLVGNVIIPPYVEIYGTNYTVVGVATASGIDDDSTNITSIIAPTTVTNIGGSAIANCISLKEISFPAVLRVFPGAFRECSSLTTISLPSCEAIGNWAFQECTNLTTVALSSSLLFLSPAAFLTCTSLEVVNFGAKPFASIPSVSSGVFADVPTSCIFVIPDEQYDDWIATSGWSDLVEEGYKFVRYSEWEYAHRYELPSASSTIPLIANGNGSVGSETAYARGNHTHPAETKVVAYRLPNNCFPITYEDISLPSDQQNRTIASNDGIRFEFDSTNNQVLLHDIASEAAGGYEYGFSSFSASTLKWGGLDAPIENLKFNNTAPTANTWPVLEKDAVFVREVQVVTSVNNKKGTVQLDASDVGALGNSGDQTLNASSLLIDNNGPDTTLCLTGLQGDVKLENWGGEYRIDASQQDPNATWKWPGYPGAGTQRLALLADLPYAIAKATNYAEMFVMADRTVNIVDTSNYPSISLILPTQVSGKARDFYAAVTCGASAPAMTVSSATLQNAKGTPATLTLEANKTNILHFTEIDNGNLAANPPIPPTFLVTGGANDGGSQPIFEPDVDGNRTAFTVGERCPVNDSIYTPITDPDTGEYIEVSGLVGKASFSAGYVNAATGMCSTAFGTGSAAAGDYSAAFGSSYAAGERSFSQGESAALGYCAHAEGTASEARGSGSHAEGAWARAFGNGSHAEGYYADAYGDWSHVEGDHSQSIGTGSHAEGNFTIASNQYEHAEGVYNLTHMQEGISNPSNTLMSVGCGTSIYTRTNAVEVLLGGKTYIKGVGNYDGTNPYDVGVKDLAAAINDKLESPLAHQSFDLSISSDLYSAISNIVEVLGGTITGMPASN